MIESICYYDSAQFYLKRCTMHAFIGESDGIQSVKNESTQFHSYVDRKLKRFLSKSKGCRVVKSTTGSQC